ncbi:MAG: aldehyde dehydrogenase family protein [Bacteroidetes bacterium]|jgi:succinate-semialdehyde dehydrogenase/glutarate-semialdehyde dehydrogenase|nr:aldehyde dehydrogenase family protein [Bacteroidota bacterium]
MSIDSRNPATEETVAQYDELTDAALDAKLQRAADAFAAHRRTALAERSERLRAAADILEDRAEAFGRLMTQEMGKPLAQATAEAEKCAWVCRYYAGNGADMLRPEIIQTDASKSYIAYQPLGPVLAVMPWNFPFWQVFRFAAPALMAGNVGLLKHASNVTGCALQIEEIFQEAGFMEGAFQTLVVSSDRVAGIIADDRVKGATVTGSEGAGRAVGGAAGKAIKPSVLELGGSDPFIVLADAELEEALDTGVTARMQNNAQSCIAAKRFIVEAPVYDAFVEGFTERINQLTVGDPMAEDTDVGPLARPDLRDEVHDQVERSVADGATLRTGGHALDGPGYFYAPTVLADVTPGTVAFEEEIFGPVAAIVKADDVNHAVQLANDTPFGLGGAVFTTDLEQGEAVALRLECGCAFVNGMVKSDPRLPFGGIKTSGYGRELSRFGLQAFVNVKTVWIG